MNISDCILNPNQIQNVASNIASTPQDLLEWFPSLDFPIHERKFHVGNISYYSFSSAIEHKGKPVLSFGVDENRLVAAVRCVSETIERQIFLLANKEPRLSTNLEIAWDGDIRVTENSPVSFPSNGFRTSNGWATHHDLKECIRNSYLEACERHFLLLSYLKFGWSGFRKLDEFKIGDFAITLFGPRFTLVDVAAGLVAARSEKFVGVTFGFFCNSPLKKPLQKATLEAIDQQLRIEGKPLSQDLRESSWIYDDIAYFLSNKFEINDGQFLPKTVDGPVGKLIVFDLKKYFDLRFPLYASYCFGGDFIPLFKQATLSASEKIWLKAKLSDHGYTAEIPERHPIL